LASDRDRQPTGAYRSTHYNLAGVEVNRAGVCAGPFSTPSRKPPSNKPFPSFGLLRPSVVSSARTAGIPPPPATLHLCLHH
jgi:hypothetical protein